MELFNWSFEEQYINLSRIVSLGKISSKGAREGTLNKSQVIPYFNDSTTKIR